MKLNNKGFGLSAMITFIVILSLFIILVAVLAHQDKIDNSTNSLLETNYII